MGRHAGEVRESAGIRTLKVFRWLQYRVRLEGIGHVAQGQIREACEWLAKCPATLPPLSSLLRNGPFLSCLPFPTVCGSGWVANQ